MASKWKSFLLRVGEKVHEDARILSALEGISISEFYRRAIRQYIESNPVNLVISIGGQEQKVGDNNES